MPRPPSTHQPHLQHLYRPLKPTHFNNRCHGLRRQHPHIHVYASRARSSRSAETSWPAITGVHIRRSWSKSAASASAARSVVGLHGVPPSTPFNLSVAETCFAPVRLRPGDRDIGRSSRRVVKPVCRSRWLKLWEARCCLRFSSGMLISSQCRMLKHRENLAIGDRMHPMGRKSGVNSGVKSGDKPSRSGESPSCVR